MSMTWWELRIVPFLAGGKASATCLKIVVSWNTFACYARGPKFEPEAGKSFKFTENDSSFCWTCDVQLPQTLMLLVQLVQQFWNGSSHHPGTYGKGLIILLNMWRAASADFNAARAISSAVLKRIFTSSWNLLLIAADLSEFSQLKCSIGHTCSFVLFGQKNKMIQCVGKNRASRRERLAYKHSYKHTNVRYIRAHILMSSRFVMFWDRGFT